VFVGRKPDERVVRLVPRGPAAADAVALARAVASELTERRAVARDAAAGAFDGDDRRGRSDGSPAPAIVERFAQPCVRTC
jgi:hypothetical protein